MPIYEYSCSNCGKTMDSLQKVNDPAPEKCEHCGAAGTLSRLVSRSSFVLKGGGWYSDLYSSSKKENVSNPSAPTATQSATGTGGGESAPAAPAPSTPAKSEPSSGSGSSSSSGSGSGTGSSSGSGSGSSSAAPASS